MAEGLFRDLVKDRTDYKVASAGLAAFPGQGASEHTSAILAEKGIDMKGFKSQPLTPGLINDATHIFTMARHHLDAVEEEFPEAGGKVYQVSEFATEDMLRNADVSDPFGGPRRLYDDTLWMLEKLLPTVLEFIEQTWKSKEESP